MSASRIGIVFNPSKIERAHLQKEWTALASAAQGEAPEVRWFETTPDDPGQGPAREALEAGCDVVVAAGGDGTVRAVSEVLAGSDARLAIVPQGTGNLLARNLGLPLGKVRPALARVFENEPRPIDVGWVRTDDGDERAFVVMVGFGIDAQMLAETNDDLKDKAGWLAYVEAIGRALSSSDLVTVRVTADDGEPREVEAHTVLVGNCGAIQGGMTLFPDAKPDDGVLDLLVVSAQGAGQWLDALKSMVWDNGFMRLFQRDKQVTSTDGAQHAQASTVRVELPEPRPFEIDGEQAGEVRWFEVRIQPGALAVY